MRRAPRPGLKLVANRRNGSRGQKQSTQARQLNEAPASNEPESEAPSLAAVGHEVAGLFASARRIAWSYVDLLTLEARRAGMAVMWLAALGIAAAFVLAGGWLALLAAGAVWAVAQGFTWTQSLLALALANVVVAAAVIFIAGTRLSRHLLFPATRRQLARQLAPESARAGEQ